MKTHTTIKREMKREKNVVNKDDNDDDDGEVEFIEYRRKSSKISHGNESQVVELSDDEQANIHMTLRDKFAASRDH